jgi:hypothetical protein
MENQISIERCNVGIHLDSNSVLLVLCDKKGQVHRFQLNEHASLELTSGMIEITQALGYV